MTPASTIFPWFCAIALYALSLCTLNGANIHVLGGQGAKALKSDSSIELTRVGHFQQHFSLGEGVTEALSEPITSTVKGVEFTYQIRLTALGKSPYLSARSKYFLRPGEGKFDHEQGLRVEIINVTTTSAPSADSKVEFQSFTAFSLANADKGTTVSFTPNTGSRKGQSLDFKRLSEEGLTPITETADSSTRLSEWTQGANSVDLYYTELAGELRYLAFSFDTVSNTEPVGIPEPQSYALLIGLSTLCGALLRRRRVG